MIAAWVLIRQVRCSWIEIGMMIICVIFFEKYCDVRTSEAVMILLILCVIYLKIRNALAEKKELSISHRLLLKCLCSCNTLLVLLDLLILTSRFYNPEITWMAKLNTLFSTRLAIGKEAFERYDIKLWGQNIPMIGNGGTTEPVQGYFFLIVHM